VSASPVSPRLSKGGLVLVDPISAAVMRVISLQYNPDSLSRSFQIQAIGPEGNRAEAMRLKGPPVETIRLEAELDGTDQLERADGMMMAIGLLPQIAALETIVYPTTDELFANDRLARSGTLEIVPMESLLSLFVWSKNRVLPVRITELGVTEEAFDPSLNPIRAKVTLSMRVLSVDDLGFDHKGGSLYMAYQQQKERWAKMSSPGSLATLGIGAIR